MQVATKKKLTHEIRVYYAACFHRADDVSKLFNGQDEHPAVLIPLQLGSTGFFLFFLHLFSFRCSWTTCSHVWADKQKSFGRVKKYIRCMRKWYK